MTFLALIGGWRTVALAAVLALAGMQTWRLDRAHYENARLRADIAEAAVEAAQAKADREAEHRAALEAVRLTYEQERAHVEQTHQALVADLRAGTVRLRRELRCPPAAPLPGAPAGSAGSDEAPDVWGPIAAAAVRVADECDAQLRAAQAVIRGDRE